MEDINKEITAYSLQNSSEALLSIQLLDFKTTFLEAVEELRMRRDSENHYEKQISKHVVEKQDLEWQKEAVEHEKEALNKQHSEAITTLKKQFQASMFAMEEEKGKYLLAVESKEREMEGLKETFKKLQISKYTLQKKLNEMEHKLRLYSLAKEDYQKKLNEFEKCHAVTIRQFEIIKDTHGKLEKNVVEAVQINKKLSAVNTRQESEINNLKEELKKVTAGMIKSKVTCQQKIIEENIFKAKEQELQVLQQKNAVEVDVNAKITEEIARLKEEKQEIMASLQHIQQLLYRETERNARIEEELNKLKEEYQILERDNELQRENAKANEEKFFNLLNEYEKAKATWKNQAEDMPNKNQIHKGQKGNKYTQTNMETSTDHEQEENGISNNLQTECDMTIGTECVEDYLAHTDEYLDGGIADEFISEINENTNSITYKKNYSSNEEFSKEDKLQMENACEKTASDCLKSEVVSELLQVINTTFHDGGSDQCNDTSKTEKTSPNHSFSCVISNILLCKHINIHSKEIYNDTSYNTNENCEHNITLKIPESTLPLHTSLYSSLSSNVHTDENINNLPLIRNVSTENSARDINEIPSKHCDKDNSKLEDVSTNQVLLLDTENVYESQLGDTKADTDVRNKEGDFHISRTSCEQSVIVNNKEKLSLKEREESLDTVMRKITLEERTKEPCSLLKKTTEDLINRSGRLSFDLQVMDKNSESLNLSRVCQSDVQMMPCFFKEISHSQEINNAQSSRKIDEMLKIHPDIRQETPVSACNSTIAYPLNTGSINPVPKRNPSEDWNATAKSFYDPSFPTEHVTREILSQSQKKSLLPSEVNTDTVKETLQRTAQKDWNSQNVLTHFQISKTENLLYFDKLCQPRKRKYEDLEKPVSSGKTENYS